MTDQYINHILKASVAALCQKIGWDSAHSSAIDILADVWKRQLLQIAKSGHRYAEHYGRSDVNYDDIALAFRDLNISIPELEEYSLNFDPVLLPFRAPSFPVSKRSNFNFLRPGSSEVLTRPVHIHEYMPPWAPTEEKSENGEVNGIHVEKEVKPKSPPVGPKPSDSSKMSQEETAAKSESPVLDTESKRRLDSENRNGDATNSEKNSTAVVPYPSSSGFSTTAKRLLNGPESPALKRVRILMQEEGHPLREISSVMMTTSGFLSSSREGRLPESRPPPNRDFFEPEPVVEKKKKIVTMKKIVEGVKKIDKEKENQDDVELFGNPDKLVIPEVKLKSDSSKKAKDRIKGDGKVKHSDRDSKHDKLKIFKKKKIKDPEKHREEVRIELKLAQDLDDISSNESFHDSIGDGSIRNESDVSEKRRKKHSHSHRNKEHESRKKKKKKHRDKLVVPGVVPIPQITPPNVTILTNPQQTLAESADLRKKLKLKQKEAKKLALPPTPFDFGLPHNLMNQSNLKPKIKKMRPLNLIPEISLNLSKPLPPPPELKPFLNAVSLAPGLIPTNLGPPPPLRLGGSNLSPSITITPAASSGTGSPGFKESNKKSSSLPLPSTVCSSVTITRIDMPNSHKHSHEHASNSISQEVPLSIPQAEPTSGITITPILMTGDNKPDRVDNVTGSSGGALAMLEDDLNSKEQRRKEKEKRKELKELKRKKKKEKKKKREKALEKERKDKEKVKEKKRDTELTIPKLTLKLHSDTSTPGVSPNRTESTPPPPRKITIKPIEDVIKRRTPSPELARFSPLVTRPPKAHKVSTPKPSPPVVVSSPSFEKSSEKKSSGKSKSRKASSSQQAAGLVTETVGFYIDAHGTKIWICPAVGCGREDDGSPMIGCDICDDWYHFACVGIQESPGENEQWFCPRCIKKGAGKHR